jgi:hypothetical protein
VGTHVERLLREGRSFLAEGRGREASLRFSRILLDDPRHEEARRGEASARALFNEEERRAAESLQQAREAQASGQLEQARRLAAAALAQGADPDRVQPLLDGLDDRTGRLASVIPEVSSGESARSVPPRPAVFPRALLVAGFTIALAALLGAVATRWESIVGSLARTPRPTTDAASADAPLPPPGEAALLEASRLLAIGQAESALRALDRISVQDPTYPHARRLRAEAEAAAAQVRAGVGQ